MRVISLALFLSLLCLVGCGSAPIKSSIVTTTNIPNINKSLHLPDDAGLGFIYKDPTKVKEVYCFGLHPWSAEGERHGGIDIIPYFDTIGKRAKAKYAIISPADAEVDRIVHGTTGAGVSSVVVVLRYNKYWYGVVNFEPQTIDPNVFVEQVKSIQVMAGQRVRKGELIGELVVHRVKPGSYPHIHYGFFYKQPEHSLEDVWAQYLHLDRSDGTHLPPRNGSGSPWEPANLGIPTTFFCPYEYSSRRARGLFDSFPKRNVNGEYCSNVCAYNSTGGNCGTGECLTTDKPDPEPVDPGFRKERLW